MFRKWVVKRGRGDLKRSGIKNQMDIQSKLTKGHDLKMWPESLMKHPDEYKNLKFSLKSPSEMPLEKNVWPENVWPHFGQNSEKNVASVSKRERERERERKRVS